MRSNVLCSAGLYIVNMPVTTDVCGKYGIFTSTSTTYRRSRCCGVLGRKSLPSGTRVFLFLFLFLFLFDE